MSDPGRYVPFHFEQAREVLDDSPCRVPIQSFLTNVNPSAAIPIGGNNYKNSSARKYSVDACDSPARNATPIALFRRVAGSGLRSLHSVMVVIGERGT